jgi:hypothetical protein
MLRGSGVELVAGSWSCVMSTETVAVVMGIVLGVVE